jgi:hypothetical protein
VGVGGLAALQVWTSLNALGLKFVITKPCQLNSPPFTPFLQEKEKLYVELKNILARQPGPEVAEQVALYQGSLRDKTKQLKAMASELNTTQAQVGLGVMC